MSDKQSKGVLAAVYRAGAAWAAQEAAMMTHLDVCSGIGGFALACRWAGFTTLQFVEIDAFCQAVLRKNFPGIPIHGDATTFDARPFRGRVGLFTAGFPCQPHSVAGKKKGRDDSRNLWPCIVRLIRDCRPLVCLLENVPNLANTMLDEVLCDLDGAGYAAEVYCVAAEDVGASHKRERLWIVAYDVDNALCRRHVERNGRSEAVADRKRQPRLGQSGCAAMADADSSGRGETCREQPGGEFLASSECRRETVADTEGQSERPGLCEGEPGGQRGAGLCDCGCDVAHAPERGQRADQDDAHDGKEPESGADARRGDSAMADPARNGERGTPESERTERERTRERLPAFPPSRTDYRSWATVASVDASLMPCVERPVRGVAARLSARLDGVTGSIRNHRLKALGNAIVPQVAYLFTQAIAESLS